jgi:hypothetical protein
MRYELTDDEWIAIKPMLPNKPRTAEDKREILPRGSTASSGLVAEYWNLRHISGFLRPSLRTWRQR